MIVPGGKFLLVYLFPVAAIVLAATAVQAQPFDHLKCHRVKDPLRIRGLVTPDPALQPEFASQGCKIGRAGLFCTPVEKNLVDVSPPLSSPGLGGEDIANDYVCYNLKCPTQPTDTLVTDQFGSRTLEKMKTKLLCAPAYKDQVCTVSFSVMDSGTFQGAQFNVDYSAAAGGFVGSGLDANVGGTLSCTDDAPAIERDDDTMSTLSSVVFGQFTAPTEVTRCYFTPVGAPPDPSDFSITPISDVRENNLPTTGGSNVCGSPVTGLSVPVVEDAVLAVLAAVGGASCDPCECDVDNSGSISATDASLIWRRAAGVPVVLSCPSACPGAPIVSGATATASISVSVTCP